MKDYRVKVKVIFTIDLSADEKIFASGDKAEEITRAVFMESFGRAHLLKIKAEELLILGKFL